MVKEIIDKMKSYIVTRLKLRKRHAGCEFETRTTYAGVLVMEPPVDVLTKKRLPHDREGIDFE